MQVQVAGKHSEQCARLAFVYTGKVMCSSLSFTSRHFAAGGFFFVDWQGAQLTIKSPARGNAVHETGESISYLVSILVLFP